MRLVRARTGSPVARFPGSLTSNELVEVERRRVTPLFASNEGLSQRQQADLTILKQPQGRPHNVAGRAVTAGRNLILDERAEMLIKAERRIPTHMQEGTNSWYRWLAPPLLVILRRVLREPRTTRPTRTLAVDVDVDGAASPAVVTADADLLPETTSSISRRRNGRYQPK